MKYLNTVPDAAGRGVRFLRFVWNRFGEDRCTFIASALTLTSLLALVPLMAVALAIFSAFPEFTQRVVEVQNFLFRNFVPDSGAVIQEHLLEFVAQAQRLQLFGILFVVVTALLLMATIDSAFNTIWRVQKKRPWVRVFLLYWGVMTLGPLLVGLSVGLTSYFASLPVISDAAQQVGSLRRTFLPFLLTATFLTLTYTMVPNCRVRIRHALWGGVLAAVLFEISKRGFTFYVTTVPTYKMVFGTLATIPLFFIWVYLSWMVVLFGAEIAHGLSVFRSGAAVDENQRLLNALEVLMILRRHQKQGFPLDRESLLKQLSKITDADLDGALKALLKNRFIGELAGGGYVLMHLMEDLTLSTVCRKLGWPLPEAGNPRFSRELQRIFREADQALEALFSVPLSELLDR